MRIDELLTSNSINCKEEFVNFINRLLSDNQINNGEWQNKNISSYLDAIGSWVEDMGGYYDNMGIDMPKNVDWNFIATLFYVGKFYE